MATRYWVVGGDYEDPEFRALIPGTETIAGPFDNEQRAKTEWTRLTCCPETTPCTTRYSIAAETVH